MSYFKKEEASVPEWIENLESWAKRINGREYGRELTIEESALAKEQGVVIVYGYSDDNMEFDGALLDEVSCFDGGTARVTKYGVYEDEVPDKADFRKVRAIWCAPGKPVWSYETDIPHRTFNIYEDGEWFCEGIVFDLNHLFENEKRYEEPYDLLYEEGGANTTL